MWKTNASIFEIVSSVVSGFPAEIYRDMKSDCAEFTDKSGSSKGKPKLFFGDSSYRNKWRKAKSFSQGQGSGAVMLAAELNLKHSGKRDAANIVKELFLASLKRETKIKNARQLFESKPKQNTPEQALSFYCMLVSILRTINIKLCTTMQKN